MQLPNVQSNNIIGLQIPPTNFMNRGQLENRLGENYTRFDSFPTSVTGKESVYGDRIEEVDATCWVGDIDDKDTAASNEKASATFSVSDSEITGFFAEIEHSGTYSCEWEYTSVDEYGNEVATWSEAAEGSMIEMHNLHPVNDADKRSYQIAKETRLNTEGISYVHSDANEFRNNNPNLVEAENN